VTTFFVILHSTLRLLIILAALFTIIRAATGLSFKRGWMALDNRAGLVFTSLMDLQLLVGLILYFFLSPTTRIALQNFAGAMGDTVMRFFAVEHALIMVLAVVAAHVGRAMVRKAPNATAKHRRTLIWTVVSIVLVLAAVPWPFLTAGAGRGWF
jgi:hypothetical protein